MGHPAVVGMYGMVLCHLPRNVPEDGRAADVLGLQGHSLQELIAQAVVEGAVEAWSTSVRLQDTKALHFVLTVHKQFCLVPIDPNQDHVLHGPADVTANQLVRDAVGERLHFDLRGFPVGSQRLDEFQRSGSVVVLI